MKKRKPTKEVRELVKALRKSGTVDKEQAARIEKMLAEGRDEEAAAILEAALNARGQ